jgi:hypothetical protein
MPANNKAQKQPSASLRWSGLSDADLLEWRFRDLRLNQHNSFVRPDIEDLYRTLERRGIRFRPHVWLSTEWFSPDGIPGIAIPFYAAHPRLAQLERRIRGEAEGGNRRWRRRILRHEAGHALDTAYGLRRRSDWRTVFGQSSKPYPGSYSARPASRRFVQHLGHWYAQSHPTEDFAETFAVWLQPKARWRREYAGWPALDKLEYVDCLMSEIAGRRSRNSDRSIVASLAKNKRTLREHYRRQADADNPTDKRYDRWLARAFVSKSIKPDGLPASAFLAQIEPALKKQLMRQIGVGPYLVGQVAHSVRKRANALHLALRHDQRESQKTAAKLYARIINDLLRRNRERYVL